MRRVVVTGMAGVTSLGNDWPTILGAMEQGRTGIRRMSEWDQFSGINTRLAAPVMGFSIEGRHPRKKTRTMGRVAQLAVYAGSSSSPSVDESASGRAWHGINSLAGRFI